MTITNNSLDSITAPVCLQISRAAQPAVSSRVNSISRAVAIRNRAHQIRSTEKIPYALAFSRAEREIEQ